MRLPHSRTPIKWASAGLLTAAALALLAFSLYAPGQRHCILHQLRACPPQAVGEVLLLYPNAGAYCDIGLHLEPGRQHYGYAIACGGSDPFSGTWHSGLCQPDVPVTCITLYPAPGACLLDRELKRHFCAACRAELHDLLDGRRIAGLLLYDAQSGALYPLEAGAALSLCGGTRQLTTSRSGDALCMELRPA